MKRAALLCVAAATLLLAGCTPTVVTEYKYIAALPRDEWLLDCVITPPPAPTTYLGKTWEGKEELLTKLNNSQVRNLQACNVEKQELRQWKADQMKLYEQPPGSP